MSEGVNMQIFPNLKIMLCFVVKRCLWTDRVLTPECQTIDCKINADRTGDPDREN